MRDRYFFDKRDWKRRWGKYGIIFLISFVPIVLFNVFVSDYIGKDWLVVFLDCIFLLIFVVIGNSIADKIFEKKDKKLERLRKEREELEERKLKIMEDSYKRKREEKQKAKEDKNADVVIELEEQDGGETPADKIQSNEENSASKVTKNKIITTGNKNTKSSTKITTKKSTDSNSTISKGGKKK